VDASRRWILWLTATLISFLALEAHALRQPLTDEKPSETLTAALRQWLGVQPSSRRRWVASALFAGFWAWLVAHVCFGLGPNDLPRRRRRCPARSASVS
jgi:hypothetical protein